MVLSRNGLLPSPVLAVLFLASAWTTARAAGDPQAGEMVFARCKACHTAEQGKNRVGPSLYGVVGRPAGSLPGFAYSDAMKNAKIVWLDENLDKYLTDPKAYIPGNKMAFPGVKNAKERQDVIAWLKTKGIE